MLMSMESAPRTGARLAVITDAFTPERFDFDLAYLAIALAADARRLGWSADIVVPGFVQGQLYALTETLAALAFLDVGFRTVQAEGCRQARAASVVRWLGTETYESLLALDPDLAVYAAEGLRSRPGFRRPHVAAVLYRPEVGSLAAQGRFLEDAAPYLADALAVRTLEAADTRAAIGRIAAAELTRQNVVADVLDPRDSVVHLTSTLAPCPPRFPAKPAGPAGRVVVLGNLDTRCGLDVVLDVLATNAPTHPELFLIGQMGDMATGHAGSEIARFAARFGGRWRIDPTIDIIKIARAVRPGDLVASYDDGSAIVGEILAAAAGAGSCGRLHEGDSIVTGGAARAPDVRSYRGLLRRCVEQPFPEVPPPAAGQSDIVSRLLPSPGAWPAVAPASAIATLDVVMICQSAPSQHPDAAVSAFADRIGPHFTATVIATADSPPSVCRVIRYDPDVGPVPALDSVLRASDADRVLVLPSGTLPVGDAAGLAVLMTLPAGPPACLFPVREADGSVRRPPLTAPALLTQTGSHSFPILLSPDSYRRHVPCLRAATLPGAVREIQVRLLIGEGRLRDGPEPVFSAESGVRMSQSFAYPLAAYDDARALAMAASDAVSGQDADAIRLYQEQALCALQNSASSPWGLEQDVPGVFARVRGVPLSSPSGERPTAKAGESAIDLGGLLGRLGRSEALLGSLPPAQLAGLAGAAGRQPSFDGTRKESFAAWIVQQGRVSSAYQIAQSVRLALGGLPDRERNEMLALARHILQVAGRHDASGHLW